MDKATFKFWVDRAQGLEAERDKWIAAAVRLANPIHDQNCKFAAPCSYCSALLLVEERNNRT